MYGPHCGCRHASKDNLAYASSDLAALSWRQGNRGIISPAHLPPLIFEKPGIITDFISLHLYA